MFWIWYAPHYTFGIHHRFILCSVQHRGPIEAPEEDTVLLRTDFISEVDALILSLEKQFTNVVEGYDADSVALRLRQQEKVRVLEQVKDLRSIAVKLRM